MVSEALLGIPHSSGRQASRRTIYVVLSHIMILLSGSYAAKNIYEGSSSRKLQVCCFPALMLQPTALSAGPHTLMHTLCATSSLTL